MNPYRKHIKSNLRSYKKSKYESGGVVVYEEDISLDNSCYSLGYFKYFDIANIKFIKHFGEGFRRRPSRLIATIQVPEEMSKDISEAIKLGFIHKVIKYDGKEIQFHHICINLKDPFEYSQVILMELNDAMQMVKSRREDFSKMTKKVNEFIIGNDKQQKEIKDTVGAIVFIVIVVCFISLILFKDSF